MWTATEPSHRHAFKPGSPGAAKRGQGPSPGFVACAVAFSHNIGALIIRIGFWGPVYYSYNKEPPGPYSNYCGPYIMWGGRCSSPYSCQALCFRFPDPMPEPANAKRSGKYHAGTI